MKSMTEPTDRQRELREKVYDQLTVVANAYNSDDKDGTMPNFHFQLGALMGTVQLLMEANR